MPSAPTVLLTVSAVIAVGYLANRLAQGTRFPEVATLLLVGLALGPGNRLLQAYGYGSGALAATLHPAALREAAPIVSGLALVVILFEAGLGMEMRQVRSSLGPALRIALPVLLLSSAAVAAIGHWVYGMPPIVAVVLGVALSNVGQTVSSALLRRLSADPRTKAIGLVEMALYDVVSVPILVTLFHVAGGSAEGSALWTEALTAFAQTASISLVIGAGLGVAWILVLGRLRGHPHSYVLTLAALLAAYAATEQLGGAGAVSVLLFGLLVGNRTGLLQRFGRRPAKGEGEEAKVQAFHEEVSFFVRTVFFLFLGLSFTVGLRDRWPVEARLPFLGVLDHQGGLFAIGAALVLAALPLMRATGVAVAAGRKHREWQALVPVFGHGLGTAVLATLPFVWHDFRPGTAFHARFAPWEPVFVNLAFLVILGSVLASGALVFVAERTRLRERRRAGLDADGAAADGAGPGDGADGAKEALPGPSLTAPLPGAGNLAGPATRPAPPPLEPAPSHRGATRPGAGAGAGAGAGTGTAPSPPRARRASRSRRKD